MLQKFLPTTDGKNLNIIYLKKELRCLASYFCEVF